MTTKSSCVLAAIAALWLGTACAAKVQTLVPTSCCASSQEDSVSRSAEIGPALGSAPVEKGVVTAVGDVSISSYSNVGQSVEDGGGSRPLVVRGAGYEAQIEVVRGGVEATIYVAGHDEPIQERSEFGDLEFSFEPNEWIPAPNGQIYLIGEYGEDTGAAISLQLLEPRSGSLRPRWRLLSDVVLIGKELRNARSLVRIEDNHYGAVSSAQEVLIMDVRHSDGYLVAPLYVSGAGSLLPAQAVSRPNGFDLLVMGTGAPGSGLSPDVQAFLYFDLDIERSDGQPMFALIKEVIRNGDAWRVRDR